MKDSAKGKIDRHRDGTIDFVVLGLDDVTREKIEDGHYNDLEQ